MVPTDRPVRGELLVAWRKTHGFSQRELARRLRCTHHYIIHIEKGRRQPSLQFWELFHEKFVKLLPPAGPRAAFFRAAA